MRLTDQLSEDGRRLFAARSFVPLVLFPVVLLSLPQSWHAEEWLGATGSFLVQWTALVIAGAGLLLRVCAVAFAPDGSSSRETHRLRATSLNTTGAYSLLRHPLYTGSALMWIGTAMSLRVWWLVVIVALVYLLYVERMVLVEEAFLHETFGTQFDGWAARTPALVPRFSLWIRPTAPIQWRRVMSEHNGLLAIAIAFALLQYAEDLQFGGESWSEWSREHADLIWFAAAAIVISTLCIIARRSGRVPAPAPEPAPAAHLSAGETGP
jgi:protein-S-isoprenylcysteine O-methyltransferase Ste14